MVPLQVGYVCSTFEGALVKPLGPGSVLPLKQSVGPALRLVSPEVAVSRVAIAAVVRELVIEQRVAVLVIQAAAGSEQRIVRGTARARRPAVGVGDEDDTPRLVVREACCS